MNNFTPGPWKFNGKSQSGKQNYNVVGTRLGYKYKIARCPFNDEYDQKESEANAKLIAAAPELLEACQKSLSLVELWGVGGTAGCKVQHQKEFIALKNMEERLVSAIDKATQLDYQK